MRQTGMLDISVRNPHTYDKFTSFEVALQTRNPAFSSSYSRTRRKYSEFCWLRKRLQAHHPLVKPPKLPSKKTSLERTDPQFLVQRMKELEDWLYDVVDKTLYLSDTSVHLFLQTQLSCDQIDQYLAGKLSELEREKAEKESRVDLDGNSVSDQKQEDQSVSNPREHATHKPVCIQRSTSQDDSENQLHVHSHVRSNSSPYYRGDSGLAMSSESSDCDSSYESNTSSLQGSSDSSRCMFPAVTLVENGETGNQEKNKLKTSPSGHMTSHGGLMVNHSIQTSLVCEDGSLLTKQLASQQSVDSETQTLGGRIDDSDVEGFAAESQNCDPEDQVTENHRNSRGNKIHEMLSQMSVETGLRYSINADVK